MNILAFGASNSAQSINQKLAAYAARLLDGASVELLDLNDYEMPLYSAEREATLGQPEQAHSFREKIAQSDALVISFAEHNGSYSAAFKNLFDWTSRIDSKVYQNKPAVFLSTSPGSRGGASVLESVVNTAPHFGADIVASMAIPSFQKNFDVENMRLTNVEIENDLKGAMDQLLVKLMG